MNPLSSKNGQRSSVTHSQYSLRRLPPGAQVPAIVQTEFKEGKIGRMDGDGPTERPSNLSGLAQGVGILLALFGVLMLVYGILGVTYVIQNDFIQHRGGVNTFDDCFQAAMFLVIGAVCAFVSVRWVRGPRRG